MKLFYLTAKKYPASTADHIFMLQMARAFSKILGNDFLFVTAGKDEADLAGVNHQGLNISIRRGLSLLFFLRAPFLVSKMGLNSNDVTLFINDPNLLSIFIFWR